MARGLLKLCAEEGEGMELKPIEEGTKVSYPVKKAGLISGMGRWIRRVGVAVAITSSAALWTGCMTTGGVVGPEPDYFFCDEHQPEPAPDFQYPGTFSRTLCPNQSTWMEMNVENQSTIRLELENASPYSDVSFQASLTDSQGNLLGSLDVAEPVLEVGLTPGLWRVTVTELGSSEQGNFNLHVDVVSTE